MRFKITFSQVNQRVYLVEADTKELAEKRAKIMWAHTEYPDVLEIIEVK